MSKVAVDSIVVVVARSRADHIDTSIDIHGHTQSFAIPPFPPCYTLVCLVCRLFGPHIPVCVRASLLVGG